MVLALLALCAFFSVVTYSEQSLSGEAAAVQMAVSLLKSAEPALRIIIVTRDQPDDVSFGRRLEKELAGSKVVLLSSVQGEPKDARSALEKIAGQGGRLDVIACSSASGSWQVFSDLSSTFPALGAPRVVTPQRYRWPNFLKSENLLNIANQIAVIAIVAIGMTFVIITGGIDLSVGSLIALSAVFACWMIRDVAHGAAATAFGMVLSCGAAMVACGAVGGFSGIMITRFGIPPFIVTLAMMLVGSGSAYLLAKGQSIYQVPDSFVWLGRGADFFGLPNAVVLMLVLYAGAHVLMSRTRLGRYLYAVGGNREAARLSGVPVDRVLLFAYVVSAALAGLGGVIMASQLKSGSATYGNMYELYVIAAVVVGGASLSVRSGSV